MQVIQVGDFNGDGRVDLLSLGSDPANSSLFDLRVLLQKPAPPDFTGGIPISSQTAIPGASASYAGTVASLNGFTGNVALSASGLPSGVTAGFSPATITGGSGSYTLTLTVGSAVPLGRYTITVMGTSGSLTHSTSVTLLVNSSVGDFVGSVAANSDSYQNVTAGQNATYIFQITPINGFSGNVTLGVANDGLSSGLPAGITGSFSPSIIVGGSGTSILTISTSPTESIGSFPLAVTATSGPIVHSGTVYLGVRSGAGDFSGFITPTSQTVAEGQTATYVANITYLNGFTPGMTDTGDGMGFMVSGLPAGAQFSTTINSVRTSTGETDSFAISAAPGTQPGTYTLLLTGSGGGRIHSTAFTLTVIPAS
jgi:hypothetical protein